MFIGVNYYDSVAQAFRTVYFPPKEIIFISVAGIA